MEYVGIGLGLGAGIWFSWWLLTVIFFDLKNLALLGFWIVGGGGSFWLLASDNVHDPAFFRWVLAGHLIVWPVMMVLRAYGVDID
jgi:hypothetical protein